MLLSEALSQGRHKVREVRKAQRVTEPTCPRGWPDTRQHSALGKIPASVWMVHLAFLYNSLMWVKFVNPKNELLNCELE